MMLEAKHLKRVYKIKNNDPVYALDDVSVKFPETGLVFILGKSGSGKSTLLNIMGGLDKADEGEIIINGKSSKDFSGSEMDSYRNTYLGFIFQEYNILSDFTVKENVALALQLQHKKATDEAINSILEQVDLAGYGKRKPNELSGGQKQRVAIARALVKEPKIIFGDEPTGALDSNTGKQVFETLKKLSKDKLVVVVSHDRDFAERFGDRVIELRDGKIISDITKTTVESEKVSDGISLFGDNIIRIEKNKKLTSEDLDLINEKLANGNDMYISTDSQINHAVCETAKINENGSREEFITTKEEGIKAGDDKFETIKSRFSMWQAFRMGARSLKVKPFRLVMTVLLSTIAFSLFGASITLAGFNKVDATKSTILNSGISSVSLNITDVNKEGFNDERITEINATGAKAYPVTSGSYTFSFPYTKSDVAHISKANGVINYSDTLMSDFNFTILAGNTPSADNEVMISKYTWYSFKEYGVGLDSSSSTYIQPTKVDYNSVIGTTISGTECDSIGDYSNVSYKICGIFDSKLPSKYEKYLTESKLPTAGSSDYSYFSSLVNGKSQHTVLIKNKAKEETKSEDTILTDAYFRMTSEGGNNKYRAAYYPSHKDTLYFDNTKTSLSAKEILISPDYIYDFSTGDSSQLTKVYNDYTTIYAAFMNEYVDTNYDTLLEKFKNDTDILRHLESGSLENSTEEQIKNAMKIVFSAYNSSNSLTKEFKKEAAAYCKTTLSKNDYSSLINSSETKISAYISVGSDENGTLSTDEKIELNIVGLDFDTDNIQNITFTSSKEDIENVKSIQKKHEYSPSKTVQKETALVAYGNESNLKALLNLYFAKTDILTEITKDASLLSGNAYALSFNDSDVSMVITTATMVVILTHVFLYVGIAMAIFAMLLFYNFISVSINNKKREIGILRAVGAKRSDVFKIFYSEAFIIAIINFILSLAITIYVSYAANKAVMGSSAMITFTIMNPTFLTGLELFGIAIGASIVSSILPVTRLANKKPIDAIQNR